LLFALNKQTWVIVRKHTRQMTFGVDIYRYEVMSSLSCS
jgi:hypothetical protein